MLHLGEECGEFETDLERESARSFDPGWDDDGKVHRVCSMDYGPQLRRPKGDTSPSATYASEQPGSVVQGLWLAAIEWIPGCEEMEEDLAQDFRAHATDRCKDGLLQLQRKCGVGAGTVQRIKV